MCLILHLSVHSMLTLGSDDLGLRMDNTPLLDIPPAQVGAMNMVTEGRAKCTITNYWFSRLT